MDATPLFLLLTLAATVILFIGIVSNRSVAIARNMARGFYVLAAGLSFAALLVILLGTLGMLTEGTRYVELLRLVIYRGWLVIGTAISVAILIVLNTFNKRDSRLNSQAIRSFITSPAVLKGICLSVAISFICTEIGKLAHQADMRQFFLQSGYPAWFLYFIIAAETAGAIGLLIPRTLLPAALGLIAIMLGAIETHLHNHDPFSDALEALHLLILLICIVVIRLLRTRVELPQSFAAGN